jgi:hypothetical protein
MTASRDPGQLIRAYLEDGPTELPRSSYQAVDERVQRTRQRVVIGPWKSPRLTILSRAVIGVAAVIIFATIGVLLLRGPALTGPGGLQPSSAPPPSPAVSPSVGASPSVIVAPSASPDGALLYRWPGPLAAGRYATSLSWDPSLVFGFVVGDGWDGSDIGVVKGERMAVLFYPVRAVTTNACKRTPLTEAPFSPASFVTALKKVVTITAGPRADTVDSRTATYVEFAAGPPVGCAATEFALFEMATQTCGEGCGGLGGVWNGLEFGGVKEHHRLWIMDVGRRMVVVDAKWTDAATTADLSELQAVVDSVYLETPLATQPPVPASITP